MSARLLALWLADRGDLPAHLRPVLHLLAHHASTDEHQAWPSIATLAAETGRSERTVQRALRDLEAGCYIAPLYVAGGRGKASRWRVLTPLERQAALAERARIKGDTGVTVSSAERVTPATGKGDTRVAKSAPPTSISEREGERAPAAAGPGGGPTAGATAAGPPPAGGRVLAGAFPAAGDDDQLAMPTDPHLRRLVERAQAAARRREAAEATAEAGSGVDSGAGAG